MATVATARHTSDIGETSWRQWTHRQRRYPAGSGPELFEFGIDRAVSTAGQPLSPPVVEIALRRLPSQGWIGRRDRALLVLSHMAGLSFEAMADLRVGNVTVRGGVATIKTFGSVTTTLRMNDDDMICGPCALARWLHALDMSVVYSSGRVSVAVIARSAPLTSHSPHLCQGIVAVTESTRQLPLLASVDQYGPLATTSSRFAPRPDRPVTPMMSSGSVLSHHQRPVRSTAGRIPTQRQSPARRGSRPGRRHPGPTRRRR